LAPYRPIVRLASTSTAIAWRRGHVVLPQGPNLGNPPTARAWKIAQGGQHGRRGRAWIPAGPPERTPVLAPYQPIVRLDGRSTPLGWRHGRVILPQGPNLGPPPPRVASWSIVRGGLYHRAGSAIVPPSGPLRHLPPAPPLTLYSWLLARGDRAGRDRHQRGRVWFPIVTRLGPAPVVDFPRRGLMARRQDERRGLTKANGRGSAWNPHLPPPLQMLTGYNVYMNHGAGLPIDYLHPVATVNALSVTSWTSPALTYPADWWIALRAFNQFGEEQNLDCAVEVILDGTGKDITNRPLPPTALRAMAIANGGIKLEWHYAPVYTAKAPSGFNVYLGAGAPPSYGSPVATVGFGTSIANTFFTTISGLTSSVTYFVGVRAYNATAEEPNTNTVSVVADATGPAAVASLTGTASL